MAQPSHKLFIGSEIFYAFIDRADAKHNQITTFFEYLGSNSFHVYTSNLVVLETFNRLEKNISPTISAEFLTTILESSIEILYPTEFDFIVVQRFLKMNHTTPVAISEIITAHLMEKNGIAHIATFGSWNNLMGTSVSPLLKS